jgi:hypothetical protein
VQHPAALALDVAEGRGELGLALGDAEHGGEDARQRRRREEADDVADDGAQIGQRLATRRDDRIGGGEREAYGVRHEARLRRPAPVDRRLAGAGPRDDLFQRGGVIAAHGDDRERRAHQRGRRGFARRTPTPRGGASTGAHARDSYAS